MRNAVGILAESWNKCLAIRCCIVRPCLDSGGCSDGFLDRHVSDSKLGACFSLPAMEVLRSLVHPRLAGEAVLIIRGDYMFGIPILSASTGAGFLILSVFVSFAKPKPVRHVLKRLLLTPPRGPPCPREIEGDSFEAVRKLAFL